MHLDVCLICCNDCVMLGLDWAEPMMYLVCMSHVHAFSCIHIINSLYLSILCCWYFSECLSLSCVSLHYGTQTQIHSVLEPSSF